MVVAFPTVLVTALDDEEDAEGLVDGVTAKQPTVSANTVTVRIGWRVLFTLYGGLPDHQFEVRTYPSYASPAAMPLTRPIPPDNSNRTRHLIRTEPAI